MTSVILALFFSISLNFRASVTGHDITFKADSLPPGAIWECVAVDDHHGWQPVHCGPLFEADREILDVWPRMPTGHYSAVLMVWTEQGTTAHMEQTPEIEVDVR